MALRIYWPSTYYTIVASIVLLDGGDPVESTVLAGPPKSDTIYIKADFGTLHSRSLHLGTINHFCRRRGRRGKRRGLFMSPTNGEERRRRRYRGKVFAVLSFRHCRPWDAPRSPFELLILLLLLSSSTITTATSLRATGYSNPSPTFSTIGFLVTLDRWAKGNYGHFTELGITILGKPLEFFAFSSAICRVSHNISTRVLSTYIYTVFFFSSEYANKYFLIFFDCWKSNKNNILPIILTWNKKKKE